jgi:6-pyruvoyltetrahydropterin/6-carboxytetrahydropterin synthase
MKLSITKIFRFSASHRLQHHNGLCQSLHGHSYLLEVTVEGEPGCESPSPEFGMIMDFGKLKKIINTRVISELDHSHLNDIVDYPTAENITLWIAKKLTGIIPISKIRLWEEIGSSYCTWER